MTRPRRTPGPGAITRSPPGSFTPPLSQVSTRRPPSSARRHAEGAVETDDLAVEHRVVDDVAHEVGVLLGTAEARRVRHLLLEDLLDLAREPGEHRRLERAGCDGHDADRLVSQVPSRRQREPDDATLAGGVRGLA